jgi:ubiquinone/menaquinone biosynthesis C-methylase UbiE
MHVMSFADIPIDRVREFWDRRPCNIRHSASPVGTRQYFDEVEARKYFVEPHIPGFAEFDRWKGRRVLEIGCGIGTDTMNFARAGAHVTAVDLSGASLDVARQRAAVFGLDERVRFLQADAERLAERLSGETFDLVYSFGVIHHSPHPDRILGQIGRLLEPGGCLKLMVYHRYSWKVLAIVLGEGRGRFWQLDRRVAENSEAQTGCPVTYCYSRRQLADLIGDRYRIDRMFVDHIFPYRIADYVQYRYRKVWYFRYLPAAVFRWMERRWGWHLCVTATMTRRG